MSEEINFKTLIMYMAGVALALFYLLYLPWTNLSAAALGIWEWPYYFALVLGLLFPLYYAIGEENRAWMVLGLAIILGSVVWLALVPAEAEIGRASCRKRV